MQSNLPNLKCLPILPTVVENSEKPHRVHLNEPREQELGSSKNAICVKKGTLGLLRGEIPAVVGACRHNHAHHTTRDQQTKCASY